MTTVDTVVIGAGHAGLAVSRLLIGVGHDHVVLDRGRVAERWRTERWDSLHLLSPNWMTRLPGWEHGGPEPDSYFSAAELVHHLEGYARSFAAPVEGGTTVERVDAGAGSGRSRYRVLTDHDTWHTRNIVIATGPHGTPRVPDGLSGLRGVEVVTANRYRNPQRLPEGGVLVVGASSSGVQIADELATAGRDVTLAVGRHTRMPRRYRGMDVFWWLEATGRLARTIDEVPDRSVARREPSLQLVGRNGPAWAGDLDLSVLRDHGVRLVGRFAGARGRTARFAPDLADRVAAADASMHRFLDTVDRYVETNGLRNEVWAVGRPRPVDIPTAPQRLDLRAEGIGTVLLATGYLPYHPWLRLPITDSGGGIRQHRGVTTAPGVYVVGQRFQHRRDSAFIDGARHDAADVVGHLLAAGSRRVRAGQVEAS